MNKHEPNSELNYQSLENLKPYDQNKNAIKFLTILVFGEIALGFITYGVSQLAPTYTWAAGSSMAIWPLIIMIFGMLSEDRILKTNLNCEDGFLKDNGFEYMTLTADSAKTEPGSLFQVKGRSAFMSSIRGVLEGSKFTLHTCVYSSEGKNAIPYDMTVLSVELQANFPHMVIDSLVEPGMYGLGFGPSTLPVKFDQKQRIALEGDFSDYFALYAGDKQAVHALTILAPDVMETLKQFASQGDIEIIQNRLYFYWPAALKTYEDYVRVFRTFENVWPQINYELKKLTPRSSEDVENNRVTATPLELKPRYMSDKQKHILLIGGFGMIQLFVFWPFFFAPIPAVDKLFQYLPRLIISSALLYVFYRTVKRRKLLQKLKTYSHS